MKKILFLAVSAVLLAVGCQKTEIQNEAKTPIGFSSQMGKLTKAPDAEHSGQYRNLYEQSFRVWGYFATENDINWDHNELYLEGVQVKGKQTATADSYTWYTEDIYYWPGKNKELDIYAVSSWEDATQGYALTLVDTDHAENNIEIDPLTRTLTVKDFEVKSSADNDLMVAPMIRQDQEDAKEVKPAFQHALTKVVVKFKRSGNDPVYVVSAKTSPINSKATLIVTNTEPAATTGAKVSTATLSWKEQTVPVVYNAECSETFEDIANVVGHPTQDAFKGVELKFDADGNPIPVTFGSWLLLPQEKEVVDGVQTDPLNGVCLDVEYIVAGNYVFQTFMLKAGSVDEWKKNQETTYNVTISPSDITFEPNVQDWANNTQTDQFEN